MSAGETPKKISTSEVCFLCKVKVSCEEKIKVFGKSSLEIHKLILRSTEVDLSVYVGSDSAAICRSKCYNRLLRYKKALDKVAEFEKEIKQDFKHDGPIRVKRLAKEPGETPEAKKSLCFGGANVNNRSQLNVTFDPSFGASSFVSPSPSHSVKYALESLYQLILANGLSEKEAEIFIWNRTVNNHGGLGKNIPHDLEVEHSNNYNKQGFGNLGVNLTEKAVTRICRAEKPVRGLIGKVDKSLQRFIRSGKHVQRSLMN